MCASSGMIVYRHGVPAGLLTLEVLDGQIWGIDLIANPDKLQAVRALNQDRAVHQRGLACSSLENTARPGEDVHPSS